MEGNVMGNFRRWSFSTMLSMDFSLVLMDSIRFRSCSRENCSLSTLNLVSTSIIAQR